MELKLKEEYKDVEKMPVLQIDLEQVQILQAIG
jgi:hypothetical protein